MNEIESVARDVQSLEYRIDVLENAYRELEQKLRNLNAILLDNDCMITKYEEL